MTARSYLERPWLHFFAIAGLAVAVFYNSLENGFHLDDYYRVVDNPGITQISRPWLHFVDPTTMSTNDRIAGYRPFLPLTLSIDYALTGGSLVGYHVGNLSIQIGAAWLIYLVVLELLKLAPIGMAANLALRSARLLALSVALLFAVHPVSGIAVNYICARDQLLSELFWAGSLLCYLRGHQRGYSFARWASALLLLAASLLSKGDAVLAPLVILALQFTVLAKPLHARSPWLHSAAFVLPVVALFAAQSFAFGQSEVAHVVADTSRWSYMLTQARLHVFRYLPQFVWPFTIHQDPLVELETGVSFSVAVSAVVVAASLILAFRWRRTQPTTSFCILAYWLMMAPTSSVIPLHHIAVDYRPYPSSAFLFLALGLAALRIKLPARKILAVSAIAWSAAASLLLNVTWKDDVRLWTHAVEHGAGPLAHHNLAMATSDLRTRRALLEQALKLAPNYILAMLNLGRTRIWLGETQPGLDIIEHAVRLGPNDPVSRYWYASTLIELKRIPDANRESSLAAQLDPRNARAVLQALQAAQAAGDSQAVVRWRNALKKLSSGQVTLQSADDAGFAQGFALQQQGQLDEAISVYREFLRTRPDHTQVHFNLGFALMDKHICDAAIQEFEKVLELDPNKSAAHLHIATCARELGKMEVAQLHQGTWDRSQLSNAR